MKNTRILAGLILLKFLLQYLLVSPDYELHRDEYLHLDQANHPAWGYLSVPPFTSWLSFLLRQLGNSECWVRFFPALFGGLTMVMVWKTTEALNGNRFALLLSAFCVLFSAITRLNMLYQPNSLDVLCWTTVYFTLVKHITTQKPRWLYIGATVFAFGFLNKYNIIFLVAGLVPALLFSKQRHILTDRHVYLAMLLGLLIVLPNLLWQYRQDFPVLRHLKELADTQLVHVSRWGFLKAQLLFFLGASVVIVPGLYALVFYKPFRQYRFFATGFVATLAIFLYLRAKDYYAIGLYPVYIAFGSTYLAQVLARKRMRYLEPVLLGFPLLLFLPMALWAFPVRSPEYIINHSESYRKPGLLRWEDGREHALPQDFADMLGWKELARKVDEVYATVPAPDKTLVLCDNYGQAGAINYYTTKGIRAVSFNADYVNWFDLAPSYIHLIRVKSRAERLQEIRETGPLFETFAARDSVTNPFAREYGTVIFLFRDARINVNERLRAEIEETRRR